MLRTITATLALEMPDVVAGSTHYSALFLLALILMLMVLAINFVAKMVIKRARRKFGESTGTKTSRKWGPTILKDYTTARTAIPLLISMGVFVLSVLITGSMVSLMYAGVAFMISIFAMPVLLNNGVERPKRAKSPSLPKYMPSIIRSASLTGLFVFIWMMVSLFFDNTVSCMVAFIALVIVIISGPVAKRIGARRVEKVAHGSLIMVIVIVAAILAAIMLDILIKGVPALSLDFLFGYPEEGGLSGGIFPAIVGTIQLVIGTMMIAFPLGIASGIYLAEYAKNTRSTRIIREAIDILNGTPSVVFGLFGMAALVIYVGMGYALIAGCITLAFMVLPVIIRTTEESILAVPHELREASLALGASKWETTIKVVIPAAFGGVVTGLILSLGRAAGETAPIMFTAAVVFRSSISLSFLDPVMALPYHLYFLASEVPGSTTMQYGTALILLVMVLFMFAMASVVRHRYSKNIKW
jgi:phosphate ABC transporter permease subunit PstA